MSPVPFRCLLAASALALGACGGPATGVMSSIAVSTTPPGASCEAMRDGEVAGSIAATPGQMPVARSRQDMVVTCRRDGFLPGVGFVPASARPEMVAAYALAGGVTGIIAGASDPNAYGYPSEIAVTLVPGEFPDARARDSFFAARVGEAERYFAEQLTAVRRSCQTDNDPVCGSRIKEVEERRTAEVARINALRERVKLAA